jgi:hypothetical protein
LKAIAKAEAWMLSDGSVLKLRVVALALGSLLILVALFADVLGLSLGFSISRNQIITFLLGSLLLVAGILGRRFTRFYRTISVLLMNLLVILALIELLALGVFKVLTPLKLRSGTTREKLENIEVDRGCAIPGEYVPFLVWKARSNLPGQYATDECGNRLTAGSSDSLHALEVYLFGGSSVWGSGVYDSATVAAFLLEELQNETGRPVRMTNLGQISWVSTQEMLQLLLMLREEHLPDVVVFLDGFNDVCTAYCSGKAGVHWDYGQIRDLLEGRSTYEARSNLLGLLFQSSNVFMALKAAGVIPGNQLLSPKAECLDSGEVASLAGEIAEIYLSNCEITTTLADAGGFQCLFFLQPTIWTGQKELSPTEENLMNLPSGVFNPPYRSVFVDLLDASYDSIALNSSARIALFDLRTLFDRVSDPVYTDPVGCHVNALGNAVIADIMAERILDRIEEPTSGESGAGE